MRILPDSLARAASMQVLQHLGQPEDANKQLAAFKKEKEKSERIRLLELIDSGS
jgi:hypothetical protein